jgi:hypothetical protein
MLYKFKSKNTADLIMLESNGSRILEIIGQEPASKGLLRVTQMPAAIACLQSAMAREKNVNPASTDRETGEDKEVPLGLATRALPFVNLLERCMKDGNDLVWGV